MMRNHGSAGAGWRSRPALSGICLAWTMVGLLAAQSTVLAASALPRAARTGRLSGHLIFVSGGLASVRPDGSDYRTADPSVGTSVSDVSLSPNGRQVAFSSSPNMPVGLPEIWVIDVGMRHPRRLAAEPGRFLYQPTWSPDGSRIAYVVGYPAGYFGLGYHAELWVMKSDGSARRPVAILPGAIERPTWAPSGDVVAFVVDGEETGAALATVAVDATPPVPTVLTKLGTTGVTWPHWSPTGDALTYETDSGLYVVNRHGGESTRVGNGSSYLFNGGAPWSPDGRRIVSCPNFGGYFFGGLSGSGPFVVNRHGGPSVDVGGDPCLYATWSPDGRAIAYLRATGNTDRVTVVSADGRWKHDIVGGGSYLNWSKA